jgi:hypothetical protein
MAAHHYPSAAFPGPLPVRLRLPDGWEPLPMPYAAMAFVDGGSPASVPTNLLVLCGRVGGDPTLDELAAAARDEVTRDAPAARVATVVRRVAGQTAIQTVLTVPVPARGVTLVQAQTVLSRQSPVEGGLDVVQVQLTCREDQWPAQRAVLDAVLDSLAIGQE